MSPAADEPEWPEPTIAEVEAAADQLAEEFRDAETPSQVEADLLADLDEPSGPRTVRVGAPESMTGPTWEEPTSQPLMADGATPASSGPGRNLSAAVITAGVLAILALVSLLIGKAAFVVVAGGAVLLGQAELYATMRRRGHQPATALGLVVGGFMMAGAYRKGEPAIAFFVVLALFLSFLWYMAAPLKAREDLIRNVGATLLGVLYGPVLASYVVLLLAQPASGRALMLTVIGLAFWYDIWAFVIGSFWGSRPLAPTISPRKSWEGLLGATAITFFSAIAIVPTVIDYMSVTKAIGLAIVVIVFAPLGDLIESLIKRDLGVKDMGSLLPGHGGVLDRIDSVLLVAPAAFYYIRLIF
jgi:phosphatidate cytidylyltransferase